MPAAVLDASFAIAMVLDDEVADETLVQKVVDEGAIVATHWRLEVANALTTSVRRKRIGSARREAALMSLDALSLAIDPHAPSFAFAELVTLADRHGLTVYDAAYLELAIRTSLPLASLDRGLRTAAIREGVVVLPA
jgi:predicted nucleic acid-binding protein